MRSLLANFFPMHLLGRDFIGFCFCPYLWGRSNLSDIFQTRSDQNLGYLLLYKGFLVLQVSRDVVYGVLITAQMS